MLRSAEARGMKQKKSMITKQRLWWVSHEGSGSRLDSLFVGFDLLYFSPSAYTRFQVFMILFHPLVYFIFFFISFSLFISSLLFYLFFFILAFFPCVIFPSYSFLLSLHFWVNYARPSGCHTFIYTLHWLSVLINWLFGLFTKTLVLLLRTSHHNITKQEEKTRSKS